LLLREHVCLFWQDDRYFNYTLPYKFILIIKFKGKIP
jgi:hypothetical protein